jgi:hypothetical protein
MLSLIHQVKDLSEPREVDPLLRFQRMLFEERNNPFVEVIQPPDSIDHLVAVTRSNHSATEEFLQCVEQLNIPAVLDDSEFGEHLKLAGHRGMRIDPNAKATFSVGKSNNPLSV